MSILHTHSPRKVCILHKVTRLTAATLADAVSSITKLKLISCGYQYTPVTIENTTVHQDEDGKWLLCTDSTPNKLTAGLEVKEQSAVVSHYPYNLRSQSLLRNKHNTLNHISHLETRNTL